MVDSWCVVRVTGPQFDPPSALGPPKEQKKRYDFLAEQRAKKVVIILHSETCCEDEQSLYREF